MKFDIIAIDEPIPAGTDAAVVIDVCRAFTTAAYAFRQGVSRIIATDTIENALKLKAEHPGSLVMGEQGGLPIPGFDLWNSPYQMSTLMLEGQTLVQRTTAGTQGLLKCVSIANVFAASFVVARATIEAILDAGYHHITFVATDTRGGSGGVEDRACAEYMIALLQSQAAHPAEYLVKGRSWKQANTWIGAGGLSPIMLHDLDLCFRVNSLPYVMRAEPVSPHVCMITKN